MPLTPLQTSCSTPLIDMMADDLFAWLPCPYAELGPGLLGVGMLVWFVVFVMMANWSEGFKLPVAWTGLFAITIFPFLPGVLSRRLMGLLTLAVAIGFYIVWQLWKSRG